MNPTTSKRFPNDFEVKLNRPKEGIALIKGSDWVKSVIVEQLKPEVKALSYKATKSPLLLDPEDQTLEVTVKRYVEDAINTLLPTMKKLMICKNQIHNNQL